MLRSYTHGSNDVRQERTVREWEYKKIGLHDAPRKGDDIDLLCEVGEEGWELVATWYDRTRISNGWLV